MNQQKKCLFCGRSFFPHPRLGQRQKSCGGNDCKRKQKRLSQQFWQKREHADYQQAQRDWRSQHPDYWKSYRKGHPAYVKRNRTQTRIRKKLRKGGLQKRIDILQVIEKQMKPWKLGPFAKQNRSLAPLLWVYKSRHEHTPHPNQPQAP